MEPRTRAPARRTRLATRHAVGISLGAVLASLATFKSSASAQNAIHDANGDGMDSHLFRPAMDSKGFFSTNGSDILGANDISFGLIIDYGRNLLRVQDLGQKSPQLVNHSFQGTAQFNYGIANVLVVGLDLPVNLMAGDEQITNATPPQPVLPNQWNTSQLDSQTLGYVGL